MAGLLAGATLEEEVGKGANSSAGLAPGAKLAVFGAWSHNASVAASSALPSGLPACIVTVLCAAGGAV